MSDSLENRNFVDRRNYEAFKTGPGVERRQFGSIYQDLTPEARELAIAVDQYKLSHRRRFVTYDEILAVVKSLGYEKVAQDLYAAAGR